MFRIVILLSIFWYIPTIAITRHKENNACPRLIEYPVKAFSRNCYVNPNVLAITPEMIELNGYKFETYQTVSEDGYRSQIFRIKPQTLDNRKNGQPIVLQHGIQVNSNVWTWMGNRSLAFVLSNAGYDVWLANQRDSAYSTHDKYKPSDYNFWTSSLDSAASNDLPAILNTVATETNKSGSIIYVGHSRGSTLAFMYISENPKKAEKFLRGVVVMSPIVYLHPVFYVKILCYLAPVIAKALQVLRIAVLNYPFKIIVGFYQILCTNLPHVCKLILTLTSGSSSQFLPDDLLTFYSIFPASVSVMQILQFTQIFRSGQFQKYDYGKKENVPKYKQKQPPLYNLNNIKLPMYMFYGKKDVLIKEKGVKRVFEELGSNEKEYFSVPNGIDDSKLQFGHNDFCWSRYIEDLFYKDLMRILDKLQPKV